MNEHVTAPKTLDHHGCRLSYRVRGEGPSVLFIQGVGVHGDGWNPQVDGLRRRFRCLTFDNRGMGLSQPVGRPLSIPQMAADALAIMDAEGWPAAHVVGHSLGGLIAQHLALVARERVLSLALLCTICRGKDAAIPSPRMMWLGLRSNVGTLRMRRHAFLQIVMPPEALLRADRDALAEQLAPLFGHDLAVQPPIAMKQLSAMARYDATPRLGELAGLRTLVVSAAHDPIARPEFGRRLAESIPGARFLLIPDASHGVPIQQAERVNELLAAHFDG